MKYYEITQVLGKIQTKAKGWFSHSVLTKRYALIGVLILLFILPAVIYTLLVSSKESSDNALRATIAAIYTDVVQQDGTLQSPAYVETAIAGTLEALDIDPEKYANIGAPIPDTGGDTTENSEIQDEIAFADLETPETSNPGEGQDPTPSPYGVPSLTKTPIPTVIISSTQQPGGETPSPTPKLTVSVTPIPSVESSPTGTPVPSKTPTPSKTATASDTASPTASPSATPLPPTEDVCANITLGGFNVRAVKVSYTLENGSSTSITISSINLDWPAKNQSLKGVDVGGDTVWNVGDDEPPTLVTGVGKSVESISSTQIEFTFKRAAASTGYSLTVTLSNGCTKSQVN